METISFIALYELICILNLIKCITHRLILQVRKHFRPELLNRLDEIVIFDPLSHDQLRKVARFQMKDVALRLAERGIALAVTDAALDIVLSESYDPVSLDASSVAPRAMFLLLGS